MKAESAYRRFAQYYDLYVGDFDADLAVYKSFCRPNERILEIGCGTGRVLQSFLKDGFTITGVDISPEMLDVAREKLLTYYQQGSLRLHLHDFREQPLSEKYELVLVTFYTFNYILEHPETFLQHLRRSMTEDARLIMDLFYPKTLTHQELDNVWATHEFERHGHAIILQDRRTLVDNIEERTQIYKEHGEEIEIATNRKYYSPEEIGRILRIAGFREIQFVQGYSASGFKETISTDQLSQNFLVKSIKKS
jgi:ubiquinone/menaquinone biosynthesis C-methylase UbiE